MNILTTRQNFEHAMKLYHSGDSQAASEWCRKSLEAAPDNVDLLTLHGVTLLDCRQPREALAPLQRAVELAPRFPRARENYRPGAGPDRPFRRGSRAFAAGRETRATLRFSSNETGACAGDGRQRGRSRHRLRGGFRSCPRPAPARRGRRTPARRKGARMRTGLPRTAGEKS